MKKNYFAPKSNVIKFEMREAMMITPPNLNQAVGSCQALKMTGKIM